MTAGKKNLIYFNKELGNLNNKGGRGGGAKETTRDAKKKIKTRDDVVYSKAVRRCYPTEVGQGHENQGTEI